MGLKPELKHLHSKNCGKQRCGKEKNGNTFFTKCHNPQTATPLFLRNPENSNAAADFPAALFKSLAPCLLNSIRNRFGLQNIPEFQSEQKKAWHLFAWIHKRTGRDFATYCCQEVAYGITYQWAVLEGIEHLEVATALKPVKVRDVFPKPINGCQVQEPLGVNLPCVPADQIMPWGKDGG